jgi:hypothetical protein
VLQTETETLGMKPIASLGRTLLGLALIAGTLVMAACGTTTGGTSTPAGYPIKVYFSNNPGAMTVTAVNRVSPTAQVEEFSIQMLIAGPTPEERTAGLFSELNDAFSGPSTCLGALPTDGPDFTLSLNMKGSTPEQGTITLKFCRPTLLPGEGTGFRIGAEIDATLKQFPGVKKVIILNMNGDCWSGTDLRGGNACLQ